MKSNFIYWFALTLLLSILGAPLINHVIELFMTPSNHWMSPEGFTLVPDNDYLVALHDYYVGLSTGKKDLLIFILIIAFVGFGVFLVLFYAESKKETRLPKTAS